MSTTSRVRRSPDEARRLILDAAERLLAEQGPHAVQVRATAERVGMTDAGVTHHFGNRQGLQRELLRRGGRRIRGAMNDAARSWVADRATITDLVERIAAVYSDGYGALAVALHAAGYRDDGNGLLDPVVELLHASRHREPGQRLRREDTQLMVAALHQALAVDPVYGAAFRRSAGIAEPGATDSRPQLAWWAHAVVSILDIRS